MQVFTAGCEVRLGAAEPAGRRRPRQDRDRYIIYNYTFHIHPPGQGSFYHLTLYYSYTPAQSSIPTRTFLEVFFSCSLQGDECFRFNGVLFGLRGPIL